VVIPLAETQSAIVHREGSGDFPAQFCPGNMKIYSQRQQLQFLKELVLVSGL
jgi:hypothetical protein